MPHDRPNASESTVLNGSYEALRTDDNNHNKNKAQRKRRHMPRDPMFPFDDVIMHNELWDATGEYFAGSLTILQPGWSVLGLTKLYLRPLICLY